MQLLKRFLAAIAGSKKAVAVVAGILFTLLAPVARKLGLSITEDQVLYVLGLLAVYIGGQAVSDQGKEAAKVHASTLAAAQAKSGKPTVVK